MAYRLTREALLLDLYAAFLCAKRHKTNKPYVRHFEKRLMENLTQLRDTLWNRTYEPEPSTCFIIQRPKKREVFAAQFRDRVVHHLYYNYTHELFERTFIADTYSCIPERGTHYGIERLRDHIQCESHNWQKECYVLKLDIRGYFMHIDRARLLSIALGSLEKMRTHRINKGSNATWNDNIDYDFVTWLTCSIVTLNPLEGCRIAGNIDDWNNLDHAKCLSYAPEGRGLPIGNLTSQLYSNVYLNLLDQFMKRTLKCHRYGRYVDDAYVVSSDRDWLLSIVPAIQSLLEECLGLELHMGKLQVKDAYKGVEFLGAYILPFRTYVSNRTLRNTMVGVDEIDTADCDATYRSVNSFLGMLVHYSSFNIRRGLFLKEKFLSVAGFDNDVTKMYKPYIN